MVIKMVDKNFLRKQAILKVLMSCECLTSKFKVTQNSLGLRLVSNKSSKIKSVKSYVVKCLEYCGIFEFHLDLYYIGSRKSSKVVVQIHIKEV